MSEDKTGGYLGKTLSAKIVDDYGTAIERFKKESKEACVLFADLVGSTEYKQRWGDLPGLVKTVAHNQAITVAMRQNGGTVVKYLGDGVMGMFLDDSAARRAIQAGIDVLRAIDTYNCKNGLNFPNALSTRIGIHQGPVWMFLFDESKVPDPQGQTVDLAARLASIAAPQQMVCTKATYDAADGNAQGWKVSPPVKRLLKGIVELVDVVSVASVQADVIPVRRPGEKDQSDNNLETMHKDAASLLRNKNHAGALAKYREILKQDNRDFLAHFLIAEILLMHFVGDDPTAADAKTAREHLYHAKQIRPEACRVWLLLSYHRIQQFRANRSDRNALLRAIENAENGLSKAQESLDLEGVRVAKTYLADAFRLRAESFNDSAQQRLNDLAQAEEYCTDALSGFDETVNRRKAECLAILVIIQIDRGAGKDPKTYSELESKIEEARKLDRHSRRVLEAMSKLADLNRTSIGNQPLSLP